jgi:hydroxybutyrate-dimer hydrolase
VLRIAVAFADEGSGKKNVTLMVQIPASFDPKAPCIVTAPSSGSRGIYGAIATAGEWGLKNGCTVAYTDKGTGTGAHNLQNDTVNLITGLRASADEAGDQSNFTAKLDPAKLAEFNAQTPNRFAFKHAHSQQNPESDWGRNVLQSIEFAFFLLNEKFGEKQARHTRPTITPENTIVIASSVSNGGGASVLAAEQDKKGLIDGIAVSEPNVNPKPGANFGIVQGAGAPFFEHSKNLLDYTTLINVFQPCASLALATAPLNSAASANRCQSLFDKGLLKSTTLAEQALEAQAIINAYGILPEQNIIQPAHASLFVPQSISVTYANSYGRASVLDNLCGYSFGATNATGDPIPLEAQVEAILFSTSNGIPPTGGVNLINNLSVGGPKDDRVSTSASTNRQDQNVDGALCLRALVTGSEQQSDKRGHSLANQIQRGIREILATGDLNRLPALIVTGRADAILAPNHTSRAYYGLNQLKEGKKSKLSYIEITNAHHLDTLNALAGFNSRFIPLHYYYIQAVDIIFNHLKHGAPLPPSQVVHTIPRGEALPNVSVANIPAIQQAPPEEARITFDGSTLRIPE